MDEVSRMLLLPPSAIKVATDEAEYFNYMHALGFTYDEANVCRDVVINSGFSRDASSLLVKRWAALSACVLGAHHCWPGT